MRSLMFAARSLVRQPARAGLGILGIAAVGALLFDMLLLSRGLLVSFRDVLDSIGFDVRVMASDAVTIGGQPIVRVSEAAQQIAALAEVAQVVPVRVTDPELVVDSRRLRIALTGVDAKGSRPWRVVEGRDIAGRASGQPPEMLINQNLVTTLGRRVGDSVTLRPQCGDGVAAPAMTATIVGVAEFPFDAEGGSSAAMLRAPMSEPCGDADKDLADMLMVASREGYGPDAAVAAIARIRPDLHPATNEQIVARMQDQSFSYFRQISTVLSSITLIFGFLLITVLMTVSVNQRVAEIAAIRALGFSRRRVAADVLWQSALLVGTGGVLAVPLGLALSTWLDRILKTMPGIPATMHFFVFEPRALVMQGSLLIVTALLAAAYPMWLVATLPIATTLRNEVTS